MKGLQTKMDVISNNIANANTTSFKAGRVRFEDMISQTLANGQEGTNPQQVGLGVQVSSVDTLMSSGSLQTTGRDLDFGIENGASSFFVISTNGENDSVLYTRDGGFYLNADNQLVTSAGYAVMGTAPAVPFEYTDAAAASAQLGAAEQGNLTALTFTDQIGEANLSSYMVDESGLILGTYDDGKTYVLGQLALAKFPNSAGLEKSGSNLYTEAISSGEPDFGYAGEEAYGTVQSGFLEMSNVDLANEFTEMIIASRAYQANSRSITTSDEMLQELLNLKR